MILHAADLIRLYSPQQVIPTKSSRKRARKHVCDCRRYLCYWHALREGLISVYLAGRLSDAAFALPRPLSWSRARLF
jgi:hypothetical protein